VVRVFHRIVTEGGRLKVCKDVIVNLSVKFYNTDVIGHPHTGRVIRMTVEALGLEDLVVATFILLLPFVPGGIRANVTSVKLIQEVVLVVV
jgi:hypothetical protein